MTLRYLDGITLSSFIYSLSYSREKELLFWFAWGLHRLTCVTHQIRGDSYIDGLADCATSYDLR